MKKKLTSKYLDSLANTLDRQTTRETIFDTVSDAVLRIGPGGMKWYVIFRVKGAGDKQPRWHHFGSYPAIKLQPARLQAGEIKELATRGFDPDVLERERIDAEAEQQRSEQLRKSSSVAIAVNDYLAANAHRDKDGLANTKRNLKHATDDFGAVPLNEVTKAMVMQLVSKRSADGKYAANATFDDIRALFNWSVGQGRIDTTPLAGLKKPHKTKPRDVFLTPDELKAVWAAAVVEPYPFGPWIRMIIATGGQRRQDVSRMRWADIGQLTLQERDPQTSKLVPIKFDHVWRDIDPSKPQDKQRVHEVPLNALAQSVLRKVPRILHAEYVFSGSGGDRPISGYSKAHARLREAAGLEKHWSVHTLRHSFATLAAEHCGALPDEVAMVQNRVSAFLRGAERVYQHSSFIRRKQRLLDDWGAFVQALVEPPKRKEARRG